MAEYRNANPRQQPPRAVERSAAPTAAPTDDEKLDRALDMVFVGQASTTEVLAAVFRGAAKRVGPEAAAELRLFADDLLGIKREPVVDRGRGRPPDDDSAALAAITSRVSDDEASKTMAILHEAKRLAAIDGRPVEVHRQRLRRKLRK